MKKKYSEYVNYNYKNSEEWFNPQVEWDTPLFIDPMLLKSTNIEEFKESYNKMIEFFSQSIVILEDKRIPQALKLAMVNFDEVREANLGYAYDSNKGKGLTGKTALSVLSNIKQFTKNELFSINDFAEISLFDDNVDKDRITDMVLSIVKADFIKYSCRIARENNFPVKWFTGIRQEFKFREMRWNEKKVEMPYITNEYGKDIPVLLIPKEFLVTDIYFNNDKFVDWIFHNKLDYIKETFNYNLRSDLLKNKKKILSDIANNNRKEMLDDYRDASNEIKPYDFSKDPKFITSMYETTLNFYKENKDYLLEVKESNSLVPVKNVVALLVDYVQKLLLDKKGYMVITDEKGKFRSEPVVSKFVHMIFEARIKDAGFNVHISPEANAGHGPVDFVISRGEDVVVLENKLASNSKLLECIDEDKQIHTYIKQEEAHTAFVTVFFNKEEDVEKINQLYEKASKYRNYEVILKPIDCIKRESASKR